MGSYFIENDIVQDITVNGEHLRSMNTAIFWPELDDLDSNDMWMACATLNILRERFYSLIMYCFITREAWVRIPGKASKGNINKKYFLGDFLSADFWQKL